MAYGVKWFRVLTVTLTTARADSISELAVKILPKGSGNISFLLRYQSNCPNRSTNRSVGSICLFE